MTTQDREQFRALALRQTQLEEAVAQLRTEFTELEYRAESQPEPANFTSGMPPLPVVTPKTAQLLPPPLPEIPRVEEQLSAKQEAPPFPQAESLPLPEMASTAETEITEETRDGLEFQFGRWLARIGVVFALITLISFSTLVYKYFHHLMGPWSRLGVLSVISVGLVVTGMQIERRNSKLTVYGRTLAGGGLACLYYTIYGATYVSQLQVIDSPLLGGFLLLGWSAYVLYLAEKKKSELLSIFAIALAYFSSAITPVGDFTMVANLILSLTAVIFLVRNAWTGLSYLCLIGTYVGLLRQFVVYDSTSDFWFEWVHGISFWPAANYLAGAWLIYTAGVFLSNTSHFAAGKRMAFLCLNNGAFIGLLTETSYLSGFGHIGTILCFVGGVFLATSYLAKYIRPDASEVAGAYLMQGLALATGGAAIAYNGVTRGLLITAESVFLAAAGAYSRNIIFRIAGYLSALLGTGFLLGEIVLSNHFSWILPYGGALAMLANAWLARRDFRKESPAVAAARFVYSSAYYILLALGLLAVGTFSLKVSDAWIFVDLALTALVLTFIVYFIPLFELPLLSQGLLVLAQIATFVPQLLDPPTSQGISLGTSAEPQWSQNVVALVTMVLATWWPRQKIVRTGWWLQPLVLLYALAIAAFGFNAVHPHVAAQGWMIAASLLSLAFLAYGIWARAWQFIVAGQIYLILAICTFLLPPDGSSFPWTWWAAAIPPATVFLTGWLAHRPPGSSKLSDDIRSQLQVAGYIYYAVALGLVVRWIFGIVPIGDQTLALFLLSTGLLLWNVRWPSAFGLQASLIVSFIGAFSYRTLENDYLWINSVAFLLFLSQPAILRRWGRNLVTEAESWLLVLASSGMGWYFVSYSIDQAGSNNMTLGWALYALTVTVIGLAANERRQRWCGLAILVAAIVRVAVYDFWGFSDLYKVLTFFVLTVICLGLSFLYYKFADRLKEWL